MNIYKLGKRTGATLDNSSALSAIMDAFLRTLGIDETKEGVIEITFDKINFKQPTSHSRFGSSISDNFKGAFSAPLGMEEIKPGEFSGDMSELEYAKSFQEDIRLGSLSSFSGYPGNKKAPKIDVIPAPKEQESD